MGRARERASVIVGVIRVLRQPGRRLFAFGVHCDLRRGPRGGSPQLSVAAGLVYHLAE